MIRNWLSVFTYHLRRNTLFSLLNVLGLAIGISGVVFAILFWNDEESYNAWNQEKGRVYQVVNDMGELDKWAVCTAPTGPTLKAYTDRVIDYCYADYSYQPNLVTVAGKGEAVEKIMPVQSNFFSYFPFRFVEGTAATALRDETSVAISKPLALRLFGEGKALGKSLQYSGQNLVVQGVYEIPGNSSVAPDLVVNTLERVLKEEQDNWGSFSYGLLIRIDDPADVPAVEEAFARMYHEKRTKVFAQSEGLTVEEYVKRNGEGPKAYLEPLETARLHSSVNGYPEGKGNYRFLVIMLGLSGLILTLSIVNYVNMTTAGAVSRAKEVGVRKILGATRTDIVWQFLMEAAILAFFAILLALAIVELALPYYNDFLEKDLVLSGTPLFAQLALVFTLVVLVAGIFPATYVAGFRTIRVLKGNFGRSRSGIWVRNTMLVLQFVIAGFFIAGSFIVNQQIRYMSTKDLGFTGDQVLQVRYRNDYDWRQADYRQRLLQRYAMVKDQVARIDGVKGVSVGAFNIGNGSFSSSGFTYKDVNVQGENMAMDFGMLDMLKIRIVKGRDLSPQFAADTTESILLNETAVRLMREPDPVGKVIRWNSTELRIVGVVADFHTDGLDEPIKPMVFLHYNTIPWMLQNTRTVYVKVDPEKTREVIAALEEFWGAKVDVGYPFQYDFVDKAYARTYENYIRQRNLFLLLNVTVILIAVFGLFALVSYSVERRMKEIAIRKTLGADTGSLLFALTRQYLVFCAIGFAIAVFPTYLFLSEWLDAFVYRVAITALPFVVAFVLLTALTLLIVLTRAYRATRVDVLKYLKYE